jgi:hypothetical protein
MRIQRVAELIQGFLAVEMAGINCKIQQIENTIMGILLN